MGLMRLPQPLARQVLQRIFTNLCGHLRTRQTMLRLLVSLLHGPMARDGAGAGGPTPAGHSDVGQFCTVRSVPSFAAAVPADGAADEESLQPVSCKRFLDMLIHLARYKPRVAQDLPSLLVATSSPQQVWLLKAFFARTSQSTGDWLAAGDQVEGLRCRMQRASPSPSSSRGRRSRQWRSCLAC